MIIGIDGNEANEVREDVGERVGVNQYSFRLLWEFYLAIGKHKDIQFIIFLKSRPKKDLPPQKDHWNYEVLEGGRLWNLTKLTPRLIFRPRIDVFFAPNHYLPPIPFLSKVCTIHDLGYLEFSGQFQKKQYWQLKYWSAISIAISKYIICPSMATKKDIVRHYSFATKKTFSILHGFDSNNFNNNIGDDVVRRVKSKLGIVKKYLLFMGTLKPSKNVEGLVSAFSLISKKYPEYLLVIAGGKGWMYEKIFEKIKKLKLADKIIFTGYVDEKDKPALIRGSKIFILPSFWEGFGIDVLNALGCGTPVVLSRVASLPEIAGSAGTYVDPTSTLSIAEGISKVLEMNKLEYNKVVRMGINQAQKFSWKVSAEKTLEVIMRAGEKR